MKNQQSGFTLLELIAVLVILAILAVTALPRFTDLTAGAKRAALDGVAGNLSSAMALNYAAFVATSAGVNPAQPYVSVTNCTDGDDVLLTPLVASQYAITAGAVAGTGTVVSCVLTYVPSGITGTFTAIGAP